LGALHAAGTSGSRAVEVEENILSENDRLAASNRALFAAHKILPLNLVSSPGSGKTTLLTKTLSSERIKGAVIEGDQSTEFDAARIKETGAPALQINTGRGCHLDAHMVAHALIDIGVPSGDLDRYVLFIENVGNLVCPASYDLGETAKVVLLSVTEGDDKPAKYPDMFAASKLMVITKMDLLPYVPFNLERCIAFARNIKPDIEIIKLSSQTGEGMEEWLSWIEAQIPA
jgi:hydrogenase nickel incorporation protein HypB